MNFWISADCSTVAASPSMQRLITSSVSSLYFCRVLTWWEMWEISDTSALPLHLTTEDHRVLETFFGDTVKACNIHSSQQPGSHTPSSCFSAREARWTHPTHENKIGIPSSAWFSPAPAPAPWTKGYGHKEWSTGVFVPLQLCYNPLHLFSFVNKPLNLFNCDTPLCPS